jgi:hypothetical protein
LKTSTPSLSACLTTTAAHLLRPAENPVGAIVAQRRGMTDDFSGQ